MCCLLDVTGSSVHAAHCQFVGATQSANGAMPTGCGDYGVGVSSGGTLTAEHCTSFGFEKAGYYVYGEGSFMQLTDWHSNCNNAGCVAGFAGKLNACRLVVCKSKTMGVVVMDGAHAALQHCAISGCAQEVRVSAQGSQVKMEYCTVQNSELCAVSGEHEPVLDATDCRSSGNKGVNFSAWSRARMTVSNSTSDGDKEGCQVGEGGQVTMEVFVVDGVSKSGTLANTSLQANN